jgi:hypothetical protein
VKNPEGFFLERENWFARNVVDRCINNRKQEGKWHIGLRKIVVICAVCAKWNVRMELSVRASQSSLSILRNARNVWAIPLNLCVQRPVTLVVLSRTPIASKAGTSCFRNGKKFIPARHRFLCDGVGILYCDRLKAKGQEKEQNLMRKEEGMWRNGEIMVGWD